MNINLSTKKKKKNFRRLLSNLISSATPAVGNNVPHNSMAAVNGGQTQIFSVLPMPPSPLKHRAGADEKPRSLNVTGYEKHQ